MSTQILKIEEKKQYDLEERTFQFAANIRKFLKALPKKFHLLEDARQLLRSSGSVGANYIEANESLSKKDFLMRVKISRKEAKESMYWLRLLDAEDDNLDKVRRQLLKEASELMMILSSIMRKVS